MLLFSLFFLKSLKYYIESMFWSHSTNVKVCTLDWRKHNYTIVLPYSCFQSFKPMTNMKWWSRPEWKKEEVNKILSVMGLKGEGAGLFLGLLIGLTSLFPPG